MRNENDDDCDDEDEEENTVVLKAERCCLEVYGVRILDIRCLFWVSFVDEGDFVSVEWKGDLIDLIRSRKEGTHVSIFHFDLFYFILSSRNIRFLFLFKKIDYASWCVFSVFF